MSFDKKIKLNEVILTEGLRLKMVSFLLLLTGSRTIYDDLKKGFPNVLTQKVYRSSRIL